MPAQVEAQDLGDAAQAELGGAVGGVPGEAEEARGGGHVEQVAAPAGLDQRRDEALDHVDRAHQVHVDHRAPVAVLERLDRSPGGDPGHVHDHLGRRRRCYRPLGHRRDRLMVGDVGGFGEQHLAAAGAASAAVCPRASAWMSVSISRPPRAAVARAVARPMPLAAPVTRQVLPATLLRFSSPSGRS